jgi:DNA-binding PadR family transcriptional regulator
MCPPTDHQRGHYLKACLALLAAESPGSVQVLTRRLAGMGLAGTGHSSVRHALSAMEADGLVEVACQSPFPMAAQPTYRLTADGTRWLRGWGLGEQRSQGGCDGPSLASPIS